MKPKRTHIEETLKLIPSLPDSALIRISVVSALFSCSTVTIWRGVKTGRFPPPRHVGRMTVWVLGEVRKTLQAIAAP